MNNEHFSESAVEHFSQTISSFARQKASNYIGQTIGEDVCQVSDEVIHTVQKVKFSIKQIVSFPLSFLPVWSHLLKKSLMENGKCYFLRSVIN